MKVVKLTFQVSLEATAVASAEPLVVLERELERIPPDSGISSEENLSQQIRQQALDAPQVNADSSLGASGVKNNNNETVINQQDDQSGGMEIAGATAKFIKVWPLTLFISNLGHPFVMVFIYYRQKVAVCYGEKVGRKIVSDQAWLLSRRKSSLVALLFLPLPRKAETLYSSTVQGQPSTRPKSSSPEKTSLLKRPRKWSRCLKP